MELKSTEMETHMQDIVDQKAEIQALQKQLHADKRQLDAERKALEAARRHFAQSTQSTPFFQYPPYPEAVGPNSALSSLNQEDFASISSFTSILNKPSSLPQHPSIPDSTVDEVQILARQLSESAQWLSGNAHALVPTEPGVAIADNLRKMVAHLHHLQESLQPTDPPAKRPRTSQ